MAQKLTAGFPADLDLPANWVVRLTAVDPTSGALVAGVTASAVVIIAATTTPDTADTTTTLVPVSPVWLPEQVGTA